MKYIVIQSWSADSAPAYNGAGIVGTFDTEDEAREKVAQIVSEEFSEWADGPKPEDWKPGYHSDPESVKWSENTYAKNGLSARCAHGENQWDKVETFAQNKRGEWETI